MVEEMEVIQATAAVLRRMGWGVVLHVTNHVGVQCQAIDIAIRRSAYLTLTLTPQAI